MSWTVRPEKKSINFALFKHPGSGIALTPKLPSSTFEAPPSPALQAAETGSAHDVSSKAVAKLHASGMKLVQWFGTYEANRSNTGKYDVPLKEGGMYALVFDNTFSRRHSKKATFVLLTYPTKSPPNTEHYLAQNQHGAIGPPTHLKDSLNQKASLATQSSAELASHSGALRDTRDQRSQQRSSDDSDPNTFRGTLQKRRRRKHQGWARRFFSLDYSTSTLTYYHDRNTSSLRGAIPLSLAAVGANAATRQISIDSGAEVWHLKAPSQKDFRAWKRALEIAHVPTDPKVPESLSRRTSFKPRAPNPATNVEEQREWARVDELLNRLRESRDSARGIAKDTDPKYLPAPSPQPLEPISGRSSPSESPSEPSTNGYFSETPRDKRPFWKRKTSSERPTPGAFKRSVSATPSIPTSHSNTPPTSGNPLGKMSGSMSHLSLANPTIHEQCMLLLKKLDALVTDFDLLRDDRKQRLNALLHSSLSRHSMESQDDIFFDAEGFDSSQVLDIHQDTEDEFSDVASISSLSSSNSNIDSRRASVLTARKPKGQVDPAFPPKLDSLEPLPTSNVHRRDQVKRPAVSPPSLIGFLRKNVGKDLSTISMPVSANEPLSLLQRAAEILEYSTLLDSASAAKTTSERLLFVAAFAISHLSSSRVRERTVRKPFNPMLGETFELVREDRNFRFLAEKVSHHPVQLACQADSKDWSITQSPMPSQKFWGKSVELLTEGKLRLVLHATGEHFSWVPVTSFLRNIIAGEKYMEPVGSMTVTNETSGEKAVISFKSGGMFSGRSEEVIATILGTDGSHTNLGLMGKWTLSLAVTDHDTVRLSGNPIWTAGNLTPDAFKSYGFTSFATTLNEVTSLEDGKMAPTDSRLRPDQRAVEDGDLDKAEMLKTRLEEAQRHRRRVRQTEEREWQPQWFDKVVAVDGESTWVQKQGADNYWFKRQRSGWGNVERIFDIH